jgi:hypothetical protein
LLIFAFRPLSGKQKNKTSPQRAQRLCGENEYRNGPLLGVVFDQKLSKISILFQSRQVTWILKF